MPNRLLKELILAHKFCVAEDFANFIIKCLQDILENSDILQTLSYLASILMEIGNYAKSLKTYREVLNKTKLLLGDDHPSTLTALDDVALVMYKQGNYDKSLKKHRYVLKKRKLILGENHPDTLMTNNNLALVLGD